MKKFLSAYLDIIIAFIIGVLFLIFPGSMINWIGLLLGVYLIIKGTLGLVLPIYNPINMYKSISYLIFGLLTLLLWKFMITFIVALLGLYLIVAGVNKFIILYHSSHNIKKFLISFIVYTLEICGGLAIFITSLTNATGVLGIMIGIVFIIIALSSIISQYSIDKKEPFSNDKKITKEAVIDAEIVSETSKDVNE